MKRMLLLAVLALVAVSTGCNSCRPRLINWSWFHQGDHCESSVASNCSTCGGGGAPAGAWVPAGPRTNAGYGVPVEDLPNPGQIGPRG